jgi:hypothetical protein
LKTANHTHAVHTGPTEEMLAELAADSTTGEPDSNYCGSASCSREAAEESCIEQDESWRDWRCRRAWPSSVPWERADGAWTSVTKPVEEPISQCRIHPEAQRIAERLDIHHIPKHGSWLNIAEIELSVLGRQYSDRRISDAARLLREVAS